MKLAPSWRADAPPGRLTIGVLAGLAVFASGARPTGLVVVDLIEVVAAACLVVIVGARTPWWLLLAVAGVAGAIGLWWLPIALAVLGFIFGAWISPIDTGTTVHADIGAFVVALTVVAFSLSRLDGPTGLSALIGVGCCIALVVGGFWRLHPDVRRSCAFVFAGIAAFIAMHWSHPAEFASCRVVMTDRPC